MNPSPYLQIGYVARAHGLGGEVAVRTFDPASTVLDEVERVLVRRRDGVEQALSLESVRSTSKEVLVALEGVQGRSAAEALVGATVLVFREDLEPPSEGEYFQGDLVGLLAVDEQGKALGTVEELWSHGEVPNLVIRGEGGELVVPFVDQYVPEVDLEHRRVVVRPLEYTE